VGQARQLTKLPMTAVIAVDITGDQAVTNKEISTHKATAACKPLGLFFLAIFCNTVGREEDQCDDPHE